MTRSFTRRTGPPLPVEKRVGSGSQRNRSRNAEAMWRSPLPSRAFSMLTKPVFGECFSGADEGRVPGPSRVLGS